jgi:hypothetical protein
MGYFRHSVSAQLVRGQIIKRQSKEWQEIEVKVNKGQIVQYQSKAGQKIKSPKI